MIVLSNQEKLIILISCLLFVVLTAIIMACKLAPFCWLYKYCPFKARYDEDDDEKESVALDKKKQIIYYSRAPPPVPDVKATYLEDHFKPQPVGAVNSVSSYGKTGDKSSTTLLKSSVSTFGSTEDVRHDTSGYVSASNKKLSVGDKSLLSQTSSLESDGGAARILCSLMYDEKDEKLSIFVNSLVNLEPNLLGNANDSFIRILLIKDLKRRWRQKADVPLDQLTNAERNGYEVVEFRTQLIRRNLNPVFNEYFVSDLKQKDLNNSVLKFAVYSVDRYSQHNVVGECQMRIGKSMTNQLKDYSIPLKEFKPELGELYLALTYLPTSQRLNVIVIKATNLKVQNKTTSINPFVKLLMVHKGKTVEKHKTPVQFGISSPVYNERLTFDLPATEVDKVTLLLLVFHQEAKESSSENSASDALSSASGSFEGAKTESTRKTSLGTLRKRRSASVESGSRNDFVSSLYKSKSSSKLNAKYVCIGRVALGAHCKTLARNHWVEVMCNPRKQIAQVHKLQP